MKEILNSRNWIIFGAVLIAIVVIVIVFIKPPITKKVSSAEQDMEKQVERLDLTNQIIEEVTAEAADVLNDLASSGASSKKQEKLEAFISQLDHYNLKEDVMGEYIKALKSSLKAVHSYRDENTNENALGLVYPDYLVAKDLLIAQETTIKLKEIEQNTWFYAAAANYEQGQRKEGEITITMVGDNSFGTYPEAPEHLQFDYVFEENNGDDQYVYKNSLPWFNSDDYTVINAESAFTNATKAQDKLWRIKSNPKYAAFLPASGIEAANLANNHTMDYFEVGYQDTLKAFAENNIDVFNEDMPLIVDIKGIKTIFLGYDYRYEKSDDTYLANVIRDVKKYKQDDNLVIVNMHWGIEYMEAPAAYQTKFGHAILDAGADIIIGGHPHRLQSVENYNGKYIVYSMGDYAFGADPTLNSRQTAMFRLTFAKEDGLVVMKGIRIVPAFENSNGSETENNYQPMPLYGKDAKAVVDELIRISNMIPNGVSEYDYFDPFRED